MDNNQRNFTAFRLFFVFTVSSLIGTSIIFYQYQHRFSRVTWLTNSPKKNDVRIFSKTNSLPERPGIASLKFYSTLEEVPNVPQGIFWYGSSIPFAPLHTDEIVEIFDRSQPGFQLRYSEPPAYTKPGSSTSVAMLLDGTVSFAELSRPLRDSEYQKAKAREITLKQVPIAYDGIVFFVNPSLPVEQISITQIREMILGKITNWQEVGGPDLPVVPYIFNPKIAPSTLLTLFEEPELEQFSSKAQFVRDYTDAIRKVAKTPGSFSYASAAIIMNQRSVRPVSLAAKNSHNYVNPFIPGEKREINTEAFQNGQYPLMRRFFIAIRLDDTIDELAGIAYTNLLLSEEGQKIIEQAGFVPIRKPETAKETATVNQR
ncbi:MAG: PstS family phosphate ABC transporter substrate-binding protein [Xenococcaceae cyanobacterium]